MSRSRGNVTLASDFESTVKKYTPLVRAIAGRSLRNSADIDDCVSEVFGEAFACAEVASVPVTVTAEEPSEIMLIECSHILHTCNNNCGFHQRLIFNLMKDLAEKTLTFHQRIEVTSKRTTREKLLSYLFIMSKKKNKKSFDIPFDRQELADYLEVDRSGLSAEISKLKREGLIDCRKNHFILL